MGLHASTSGGMIHQRLVGARPRVLRHEAQATQAESGSLGRNGIVGPGSHGTDDSLRFPKAVLASVVEIFGQQDELGIGLNAQFRRILPQVLHGRGDAHADRPLDGPPERVRRHEDERSD